MNRLIFIFGCLFLLLPLRINAQAKTRIDSIIYIIKHQRDFSNYTLIAAHRGYWADFPENSIGSYLSAIEIGADIVEMDVRLTKDDVMVIFHDACLDRVTSGYGRLRDEYWGYVSELYLRDNLGNVTDYRVLKLSEALDALKGKAVASIDIKETGALFTQTMLRTIQMVKDKGMLNQTLIKGKMPLNDLQTQILNLAGVTLDDFIYTPIAFSNTRNLDSYIKDYVNSGKIYAIELVYKQSQDQILDYISLLTQHGIWIGQYSFWPETNYGVFAEKAPLTDCDIITRDYNFKDDPSSPPTAWDDGRGDWDWLSSKGANYIITDRGELMIDYLKAKGKRTK
ncbi:MAG: glycerophosphodiester phosphodiesterase family protein [Bacteroidales bacterium]|jgi:glycerophosphoryl diester phosphodiesterase|nr:glycerophosphodiester phosphodiesterase family protein [Bacteroidales bacterium]